MLNSDASCLGKTQERKMTDQINKIRILKGIEKD